MKEKIKEYQFTLGLIAEHGNDSALLSIKNDIETEILKSLNPLIFKMAKYFNNNFTLHSDFIQEGRMGIIEAMEKYDCDSTLGFPAYSKFDIKNIWWTCIINSTLLKCQTISTYYCKSIEKLATISQ